MDEEYFSIFMGIYTGYSEKMVLQIFINSMIYFPVNIFWTFRNLFSLKSNRNLFLTIWNCEYF